MNAKRFFSYLPLIRLPMEAIERKEIDNNGYQQQLAETTPVKRQQPLALEAAPLEILELFQDHDVSSLKLLSIPFLPEPRKVTEGWHIADMPQARVIRVASGRIEAYGDEPESAMPGDSPFVCAVARNLGTYLEAMTCGAMAKAHFARGPADDPAIQKKRELIMQLCAAVAGGQEYDNFWLGLTGNLG
jgi:hypothetical protein